MLYATAEFIGVNPPALVTYAQHTGMVRVERDASGKQSLIDNPASEAAE